MAPRRVDHWVIRVGWTPTICRTGCPGVVVRPFGESEARGCRGGGLLRRCCRFGCGHSGFEQDASVDAEPASIEGLDLVSHGHVSVQIGVSGAAVAVGERGPLPTLVC
jgi:hypothetical protein